MLSLNVCGSEGGDAGGEDGGDEKSAVLPLDRAAEEVEVEQTAFEAGFIDAGLGGNEGDDDDDDGVEAFCCCCSCRRLDATAGACGAESRWRTIDERRAFSPSFILFIRCCRALHLCSQPQHVSWKYATMRVHA